MQHGDREKSLDGEVEATTVYGGVQAGSRKVCEAFATNAYRK
jgi:hypothetical protein